MHCLGYRGSESRGETSPGVDRRAAVCSRAELGISFALEGIMVAAKGCLGSGYAV